MLEIDQPSKKVGFAEADEARRDKGGAFFEHLRKHSFILASESGRHTDPETGNTHRNFAVWRPEGARISYLREEALTEKYRPVAPETARDWWTAKYATIPDIRTSKLHVIGGAITPLWQSLKTTEATHLRVVRVTSDDGQRIVGVQISSDQVSEVLRALGVTRSLRESSDIFNGVFIDGEEIALTAGLKLKRGRIHGDPVIELCGAQPSLFATLRKLGLINEQLNFKQRFFVPVEEERGNAIIAALLEQFPVIADEHEPADDLSSEVISTSSGPTQVVDLENWVIEPTEVCRSSDEPEPEPTGIPESESSPNNERAEPTGSQLAHPAPWSLVDESPSAAMFLTPQHYYGGPAVQLGFNFAESES